MNTLFARLSVLTLALSGAHCSAVVAVSEADARVAADAAISDTAPGDAPDAPRERSCAEVQAACGPLPQQFVRGHAEGLTGVDGARVQFAIRYLPDDGDGLDRPHGVVSAWSRVAGGAFEACVCMPRGGNMYPQLAAVVFAPGSTGETSRDVVRAVFSLRYATSGNEELTQMLAESPSAPVVEASLAAMVDRASTLTLRGLPTPPTGARVYGGLVADERPVAAEVTRAAVEGPSARFQWIMPGRQWPSERLVFVVDANNNRRCDDGDQGGVIPRGALAELTAGPLLTGAQLSPVCRALSLETSRE